MTGKCDYCGGTHDLGDGYMTLYGMPVQVCPQHPPNDPLMTMISKRLRRSKSWQDRYRERYTAKLHERAATAADATCVCGQVAPMPGDKDATLRIGSGINGPTAIRRHTRYERYAERLLATLSHQDRMERQLRAQMQAMQLPQANAWSTPVRNIKL